MPWLRLDDDNDFGPRGERDYGHRYRYDSDRRPQRARQPVTLGLPTRAFTSGEAKYSLPLGVHPGNPNKNHREAKDEAPEEVLCLGLRRRRSDAGRDQTLGSGHRPTLRTLRFRRHAAAQG